MQDRYLVLTPEKVVVSYELAGIGTRIAAHFIDLLVFGAVMYVTLIIVGMAMVVFGSAAMFLLMMVTAFGFFAYFIVSEAFFQGLTIGKKACKLRVLNVDGTPVSIKGAVLRNLVRIADILPNFYLAGITMLFLNPKAQRIGDLVAGTVVVKEPERFQGFTPAPYRVGLHPLEDSVGELLQMTIEEYHAIKRLTDRFPYLTAKEQQESVATIWQTFAQKHKIQPLPSVHPVYQMEAVVMKYGRMKKLV